MSPEGLGNPNGAVHSIEDAADGARPVGDELTRVSNGCEHPGHDLVPISGRHPPISGPRGCRHVVDGLGGLHARRQTRILFD